MPVERTADHVEKRLGPRERCEPEAVARLRSEAALLTRLSSLGVTPRLLANGEDGLGPWHWIERIVMPTLAEHISARGLLPPAWLERAIAAAFDALARLHEASDALGPLDVVHADLSPSNMTIDEDVSRVVFLDFDLALWRDAPPRDGAFRGTVAYVAPEVARGELPTAKSDLFSLAATLLHGVLGVAPRRGPSFAALLVEAAERPVLDSSLVPLGERGPGHAALLRCLAHDVDARPESARSVLELLDS